MAVRSRSLVLLFLALASGAAAAWLSIGYLRRQARPLLNPAAAAGRAVVAARDLPVGAVLTERDIRTVDWPGDAVPPGLVSRPEDVLGRGIITAMRLHEPVLEAKLAPRGRGGSLPIIIDEGMRALSIRVDDVVGVAGFVVPGTRVDVLLTMDGEGTNGPTTKAILQNLQALAAGQALSADAEGRPMPVPVVTVMVSPEQAETLTMAANQGRIQLALRNALDTLPIRTTGARAATLLGGSRGGPSFSSTARRLPTAPTTASQETVVEGFRGGERTVTRFARPRPPQPEIP